VYLNIIYNFYDKAYTVKQTVFIKQEQPFFEKLNFLQNLDCSKLTMVKNRSLYLRLLIKMAKAASASLEADLIKIFV
jgi:hypothetical protein